MLTFKFKSMKNIFLQKYQVLLKDLSALKLFSKVNMYYTVTVKRKDFTSVSLSLLPEVYLSPFPFRIALQSLLPILLLPYPTMQDYDLQYRFATEISREVFHSDATHARKWKVAS